MQHSIVTVSFFFSFLVVKSKLDKRIVQHVKRKWRELEWIKHFFFIYLLNTSTLKFILAAILKLHEPESVRDCLNNILIFKYPHEHVTLVTCNQDQDEVLLQPQVGTWKITSLLTFTFSCKNNLPSNHLVSATMWANVSKMWLRIEKLINEFVVWLTTEDVSIFWVHPDRQISAKSMRKGWNQFEFKKRGAGRKYRKLLNFHSKNRRLTLRKSLVSWSFTRF